jgi:hypothetical protein
MPDVPNVPGVPPLSSYSPGVGQLLTSDSVSLAEMGISAAFSLWGIYINGVPVVLPAGAFNALGAVGNLVGAAASAIGTIAAISGAIALPVTTASFVDVEYKQDWPISDYPVEAGGFQSYDKVQLPFDLKVRLAGGGSAPEILLFLNAIDAMANSIGLFSVITPEGAFNSLNVSHYDYKRTAKNGVSLIVVDVWFTQIRVTSTATFTNTQSPANADPSNIGIQQPQTPAPQTAGVGSQVN